MSRLLTKTLDYDAAHQFVERTPDVSWDGHDIVTWVANPKAFFTTNGAFRRDKPSGRGWGFEYRTKVSSDGKWRVKVVSAR